MTTVQMTRETRMPHEIEDTPGTGLYEPVLCCTECHHELTELQTVTNDGICQYCGIKTGIAVVRHFRTSRRWVYTYHPGFWARLFLRKKAEGHWEYGISIYVKYDGKKHGDGKESGRSRPLFCMTGEPWIWFDEKEGAQGPVKTPVEKEESLA